MSTIVEKLTASEIRPKVVAACVELVDREVDSKGGLSGMAVKAGYKVIKTIKPGFVNQVLDTLLPEFAAALEPFYARQGGGDAAGFVQYLQGHNDEVADALLGVTDARAERAKNATIRKTYERLRGGAREHVATAVPQLATTLRPFL